MSLPRGGAEARARRSAGLDERATLTRARLTGLALLALVIAGCKRAAAHEGHVHEESRFLWNSVVAALIAGVALGYAIGVARLWARAGVGHGVRGWQLACFVAALGVLVLALLSPLDALSDVLFSAHMAQHELLMLLAAPLFVLGVPYRALTTALPARVRPSVVGVLRGQRLLALWRGLTAPVVALVLQILVLSAWHVPVLFEAALRSEPVHSLQHASFFLVAALFWWSLIAGRYGRLGYGAALLFVFITALHGGTLGALITVARLPWYETHAQRTEQVGLEPLADQQLAGLLMWVPGGLLLLASALALGVAWLGALERRAAGKRA